MAVAGGKGISAAPGSTNSVSLKTIEVHKVLQSGEKFIKWDEVSLQKFSLQHAELDAKK